MSNDTVHTTIRETAHLKKTLKLSATIWTVVVENRCTKFSKCKMEENGILLVVPMKHISQLEILRVVRMRPATKST